MNVNADVVGRFYIPLFKLRISSDHLSLTDLEA